MPLKSVSRRRRPTAEARLFIKALLIHAYLTENVPQDMLDIVGELQKAEDEAKVLPDRGDQGNAAA